MDTLTKSEFNIAYIAHIIADSPSGPRGDKILSKQMAIEISNLMLLCDEHHRLIDKEKVTEHPVELLQKYKKNHEERINRVTGIIPEMESHIILYGANVGEHSSPINKNKANIAILENGFYPAESDPIELSLKNSAKKDDKDEFWKTEKENLFELFNQKVKYRLKDGIINHLSIFGIAPQPLLIYLGHLLSDLPTAEVYQLHRSPPDWVWKENVTNSKCHLLKSDKKGTDIALVISISQKIEPQKIFEILGENIPVWTITVEEPNSEYLRSNEQLEDFRILYKKALSEMKFINGDKARIHLFPASPVSVAIEMGRARLQKADLPMTVYDYNERRGGFVSAIDIG